MSKVRPADRRVLVACRAMLAAKGKRPTCDELAAALRLSDSEVWRRVDRLRDAGLLPEWPRYRPRPRALGPLPPKQAAMLEAIKGYLAQHGKAPTLRELQEHFGLKTVSSPFQLLARLEARGLIRRDVYRRRAIEVVAA